MNAYDNTILYTDDFLHRAIGLLKAFPETATMLMYISDHGESLGEYGLYLHGTPYSIAPDVQKDVPFLVWMSDAFKQKMEFQWPNWLNKQVTRMQMCFTASWGPSTCEVRFTIASSIYSAATLNRWGSCGL